MPEVPPPALPKLEPFAEEAPEQEAPSEPAGIPRERLVAAMAKMIGFISAVGLPKDVFVQEAKEFAQLAEETGFAESLCILIEYYFPDLSEYSPWVGVVISGSIFAAVVWTKRAEIQEKLKKEKVTIKKMIEDQERKIKKSERIEEVEKREVKESE